MRRLTLTCAGLLVLVELEAFVAVAAEDARSADADLFTVVLPFSAQVDGYNHRQVTSYN